MKRPKQKVLAYITRSNFHGTELLVFTHRDFPKAGVQVPAGTVDSDESFADAILREVKEESGLEIKATPRLLGSFDYLRPDTQEQQVRNVFHFLASEELPDHWEHSVSGHGEDENMVLQYYWVTLADAQNSLAVGQGDYLHML